MSLRNADKEISFAIYKPVRLPEKRGIAELAASSQSRDKARKQKKTTSSAECNNHASEEAENSNENLTGARMELADR